MNRVDTHLKKIALVTISIIFVFSCSAGYPFFKKQKTKVLLIGIDGATWKVMTPLIEQGKLPNIKQLMDKGAWGNLETEQPLCSEVIWTTISTGKSPKKHGITNRLMQDPDTGDMVTASSDMVKVKRIWSILSENKKKVGMIGYRMSWPPDKVNGIMISDRIDKEYYLSKDYSCPPFAELCSKEEFDKFFKIRDRLFPPWGKGKKDIRSVEERDNFMVNFSRHIIQKHDFDFFSLYIYGTDVLSHLFWKYLFPERFTISEKQITQYKDVINDYYIFCDDVIGDLLKRVDEETIIIIVSDHGFGTEPRAHYYIFYDLYSFLDLCGLTKIEINSKTASLEIKNNKSTRDVKTVKIAGALTPEEFIEAREKAKTILESVKIKEINIPVFYIARDTQDGFVIEIDYHYLNQDISYHIRVKDKDYEIKEFLSPYPFSGNHDKQGIIIVSGKNISQNKTLETATIYDITPTILYVMGLPVAKDMKGKVLIEAMDNDLLRRNPIRYIDTYETGEKKKVEKPVRSPQDEERLIEMMRSLGYIN